MVGNTGFSAVIDPTGHVDDRTALFSRAIDSQTVPLKHTMTFYQVNGDLFSKVCLGEILFALAGALVSAYVLHRKV